MPEIIMPVCLGIFPGDKGVFIWWKLMLPEKIASKPDSLRKDSTFEACLKNSRLQDLVIEHIETLCCYSTALEI